jgi:basic endochitinase B
MAERHGWAGWVALAGLACGGASSEDSRSSAGTSNGGAFEGSGGKSAAGGNGGSHALGGNGSVEARGGSGAASSAGGDAGSASEPDDGAEGAALEDVLTPELYASMFPNANVLYAYDALITAAAAYPGFGSTGTGEQRRREVAAFFGNAAHETTGGWPTAPGGPEAWGLYFIEEVGCEAGDCSQYCDASNTRYPCAPGKTYHGRGPIQLSWNYNYGALGEALGLPLLEQPEAVTSDGRVAFTTALWFWMTAQPPKPSAHDVMVGRWSPTGADTSAGRAPGFGMTVNIINGGLECGIAADERVLDRVRFYRRFTDLLGTTDGDNLECATMQSY